MLKTSMMTFIYSQNLSKMMITPTETIEYLKQKNTAKQNDLKDSFSDDKSYEIYQAYN